MMRWTMKWDLRTTETSEDFLVLVLPFEFKLKNESVAFTLPIPISCKEIEIQIGKEVKHLEENDNEKSLGCSSKGWQTRSEGGQSCQGKWTRPYGGGKWKDIPNV